MCATPRTSGLIAEKLYPAAGLLNENPLMMWASKVVPCIENRHWSFGVWAVLNLFRTTPFPEIRGKYGTKGIPFSRILVRRSEIVKER
jgi:hypothetical protein